MGYLTREILQNEIERYGAAGINPQVVWPNGLLASLAVRIVVELVTGWSKKTGAIYLTYDGNRDVVASHPSIGRMGECTHYPLTAAGDPILQ